MMADPATAPSGLDRTTRFLASTDIFVITLLWLIVLLIVGTVAQKYIGLHEAQARYFGSWIAWFGPVPVPGGRTTMTIVFVNLLAKLLFASSLHWRRSGVLIAHLGALLLLLGGFITAYRSVEGTMVIPEGEQSSYFQEYHALEIAITDTSHAEFDQVTAYAGGDIAKDAVLELDNFTGEITVEALYANCEHTPSGELQERPKEVEQHLNTAGAQLRISGAGEGIDGVYFVLEYAPRVLVVDEDFQISLRKQRHRLPFTIALDDFEMSLHPGTGMARDYRSHVLVHQGETSRRATIWMNHPLREGGYTFYQSSYLQGPQQGTILAVVRNAGRLFPYISSGVICVGLLIHLTIMFIDSTAQRNVVRGVNQ